MPRRSARVAGVPWHGDAVLRIVYRDPQHLRRAIVTGGSALGYLNLMSSSG